MTAARGLAWLVRLIAFLLLLGFAIKNSDVVTLRFFFGMQWRVPLVLVMLAFFGAGAAIGLTVALSTVLRQRRELGRSQRGSAQMRTQMQVRESVQERSGG